MWPNASTVFHACAVRSVHGSQLFETGEFISSSTSLRSASPGKNDAMADFLRVTSRKQVEMRSPLRLTVHDTFLL